MPRERSFFIGLIVLLAIGLVSGWLTGESREVVRARLVPELASAPAPAHRPHRRWRSTSLEPAEALGLDGDLVLDADEIDVGQDGRIHVLRLDQRCAYTLSADGRSGPCLTPEALDASTRPIPVDLASGPDGSVWVAYSGIDAVALYDSDGRLERWGRPESAPHRLASWGDGGFAILCASLGDHMVEGYGDSFTPIASFGRLVDGAQHPMLTEGALAPDGDRGLVYAGQRVGVLAAWDRRGTRRFLRRTIDATPVPALIEAVGGHQHLEAGSPLAALDVAVDRGAIYVLSAGGDDLPAGRTAIDVYDLADGTYQGSIDPPGTPHDLAVRDGLLYTLEAGRIRAWRLGDVSGPG